MPAPGRLARLAHVVVGELLTSRAGSRLHLLIHRASGGRAIRSISGFETVVLTTTGRRSGRLLDAPLTAIRDGARWVVVASNGGKDRAPGWLHNLRAEPSATLAVGPERFAVRAREADPEETARLWPAVVDRYRGYETYRGRTAREIPLVILERDGSAAGAG